MNKLIYSGFLALVLLLVTSKYTNASEGHVSLKSTIGKSTECDVKSTLLGDYNLLISCTDLTYSVSEDLVYYVVWANPVTGVNAIRLGDLGLGRALLKTKVPFSSLFVTQEKTKNPKAPTGSTVMRGNVTSIGMSSIRPGTTIVPSTTSAEGMEASPSPAPSSGGIGNILRSSGVVIAIAIFLIILMLILVKPFK